MKICHVITRLIVGGAQENTMLTIRGHLEKGHDVTLATGYSPGREGKLLENAEYGTFPVVEGTLPVVEVVGLLWLGVIG